MINYLINYIEEKFLSFHCEIYLRFELGEPYENGTDLRINQVIKRVTTLFEEMFKKEDTIYIYIKDYCDSIDVMFGDTTPHYLYELVNHLESQESTFFDNDEDIDACGNTMEIKIPYKIKVFKSKVSSIPYKEILSGIANYEQGLEPSIGQGVYFINTNTNVLFNMYDDRGCIIYSGKKDNLNYLYIEYNDWLVNYWRNHMDNIFKKN